MEFARHLKEAPFGLLFVTLFFFFAIFAIFAIVVIAVVIMAVVVIAIFDFAIVVIAIVVVAIVVIAIVVVAIVIVAIVVIAVFIIAIFIFAVFVLAVFVLAVAPAWFWMVLQHFGQVFHFLVQLVHFTAEHFQLLVKFPQCWFGMIAAFGLCPPHCLIAAFELIDIFIMPSTLLALANFGLGMLACFLLHPCLFFSKFTLKMLGSFSQTVCDVRKSFACDSFG